MNIARLHSQIRNNRILKTEFQKQAARNTQIQTSQTRQPKDSVEITRSGRRSPKRIKDRDELFTEFGQAFSEKFAGEEQGELSREAEKQAGDQDVRPYLAALSYRRGMEELRQTKPGLSRSELREASIEDPELSKTLAVVDKAAAFLNSEKRMEEARERQQTQNRVREIYQEMMAENRKSFEQIRQIKMEADNEISEIWKQRYLTQMKSWNDFHKNFLKTLLDGWD